MKETSLDLWTTEGTVETETAGCESDVQCVRISRFS